MPGSAGGTTLAFDGSGLCRPAITARKMNAVDAKVATFRIIGAHFFRVKTVYQAGCRTSDASFSGTADPMTRMRSHFRHRIRRPRCGERRIDVIELHTICRAIGASFTAFVKNLEASLK
jgi:hypothetical protein